MVNAENVISICAQRIICKTDFLPVCFLLISLVINSLYVFYSSVVQITVMLLVPNICHVLTVWFVR